jgi:hypothetical protein
MRNCGLNSAGSGQRPLTASREHGNVTSGSVEGGELIHFPSDFAL